MRHILSFLSLCISMTLMGCDSFAMLSETLTTDSICIADSVVFNANNKALVNIKCQYPVNGNPILVDSINVWIASCLMPECDKQDIDIPAIAASAMRERLTNDSSEVAAIVKDDAPDYMYYSFDNDIFIVYEDDNYITFGQMQYSYMGGAHGSTMQDYATFCKSGVNVGHRMGWDLLSETNPSALRKHIKKGLAEYLGVAEDELLNGCLFVEEGEDIPFPQTEPYLTKDGVKVIYQEYEIGPYAMGCPEIVVGQIDK